MSRSYFLLFLFVFFIGVILSCVMGRKSRYGMRSRSRSAPKTSSFQRPNQQTEFRTLGLDLCVDDDPPASVNSSFAALLPVIRKAYFFIKSLPVTFVPGPHVTGFGTLSLMLPFFFFTSFIYLLFFLYSSLLFFFTKARAMISCVCFWTIVGRLFG